MVKQHTKSKASNTFNVKRAFKNHDAKSTVVFLCLNFVAYIHQYESNDSLNPSNPLNAERDIALAVPVCAAIAHLWFETIHPFEDGNGRVGRVIAEMALAQDLNRPLLLSLSTIIEKDKNAYYDGLNKASQFNLDITDWVTWFVDNAGPDGFEGGLSAKKYISITSSSKATATLDLSDSVEKDCLYHLEGGGRNARHGLAI